MHTHLVWYDAQSGPPSSGAVDSGSVTAITSTGCSTPAATITTARISPLSVMVSVAVIITLLAILA